MTFYRKKVSNNMDFLTIIKLVIVLLLLVFGLFLKKKVGNKPFNYMILVLQTITLGLFFTDTFYRMNISIFAFDLIFWSLLALGIVCSVDSSRAISRLSFLNIPMTFIFFMLVAFFLFCT